MAQTANAYSTEISSTTSTGSLLSVNFSFDANHVRIANRGTAPLRYSMQSTIATTDDGELRAGEATEWRGLTYRMAIMATSTSTDGTEIRAAHVYATGG